MNKLCVVTGSRSDYGLLKPVLKQIQADSELTLQLVVTGMHLDDRYGLTYQEIEKDGFTSYETFEMNQASDTNVGTCISMGVGMIGLAGIYERLQPDMILLLGDRYEIFVAASVATISKIPIAHIHGGEITQGAYDDCLRHAITKMSYLHFTSTNGYRNRVIQMGEHPERVYNVGALGIENIKKMKLLLKEELQRILQIELRKPFLLVTFHPVTLALSDVKEQLQPLLEALDCFQEFNVIFTKSNSDAGGYKINQMIDTYVVQNSERAVSFTSLGTTVYLSLMGYSCVVIGNSSSGIIEAPFLKVPTVNIGDRQKGRGMADSIVSCQNSYEDIVNAIKTSLQYKWSKGIIENPYEKEDTSYQIIRTIKQELKKNIQLNKSFYDLGVDHV